MAHRSLRKKLAAYLSTRSFRHILGMALLALFLFFISVLGIYIGGVKLIDAMRPAPFKDGKVNLTVSLETTYVEGPVNDDGTVNYAPHLLGEQKKLPPEKNAAFYLVKAIGPRIYGDPEEQELIEKLRPIVQSIGIGDLSKEGERFQDIWTFITACKNSNNIDAYEIEDALLEKTPASWSETEYLMISKYLQTIEKTLELIVCAGEAEGIYIPLPEDNSVNGEGMENLFYQMRNRELLSAFRLRILFLIRERNTEAAKRELLAFHRLNFMVTHWYLSLLNVRYGFVWDHDLLRMDTAFILSSLLKGNALIDYGSQVDSFRPSPQLWKQFVEMLRLDQLYFIMRIARSALKKQTHMQEFYRGLRRDLEWDYLLRQVNKKYDRLITIFRTNNSAQRARLREKYEEEIAERREVSELFRFISDHFGTFLNVFTTRRMATKRFAEEVSNNAVGCFFTAHASYQEAVAKYDLIQVTCALAAYKQQQGTYPSSLTSLKPHYMKTIPKDVFTGKPFHYKQKKQGKGFLLYSVGRNKKDEGGEFGYYSHSADDIVISDG